MSTDIGRLAAQFAAGTITAEAITTIYGDDILTQVLAYTLGGAVGAAGGAAIYDAADDLLDGTLSDVFDFDLF